MTTTNFSQLLLAHDIKHATNILCHKEDLWEKYRLRTIFVLDWRLCRLEQYAYKTWDNTPQNVLNDRIDLTSDQAKKLLARYSIWWEWDNENVDSLLDIYYSSLIQKGFVSVSR